MLDALDRSKTAVAILHNFVGFFRRGARCAKPSAHTMFVWDDPLRQHVPQPSAPTPPDGGGPGRTPVDNVQMESRLLLETNIYWIHNTDSATNREYTSRRSSTPPAHASLKLSRACSTSGES